MTSLREAAQAALEALELWKVDFPSSWAKHDEKAIKDLRAALGQPDEAQQAMLDLIKTGASVLLGGKRIDPASVYKQAEPVAWMYSDDHERMLETETFCTVYSVKIGSPDKGVTDVRLYTAPPQRQPLTTEERSSIANQALRGHASTRDAIDWAIRHVERHHGIQPDPAADAMRDFFRNGVGVIAAD